MGVDLHRLLKAHGAGTEGILEAEIPDCVLSFLQIRDRLYLLGHILYEDPDNRVYVAAVRSGFADLSSAIVAMQLCGNTLRAAAWAREGLIHQRICEKAVTKLRSAARGGPVTGSRFPRMLPVLLTAAAAAVFITVRSCAPGSADPEGLWNGTVPEATEDPSFAAEVQLTIEATRAYNQAVEQFNRCAAAYNEAVALTCIENISGLPDALETLSTESEGYEENAAALRGGNSREVIGKDTQTVLEMTRQVERLTAVVRQITAPAEAWVMDRLSGVEGITGTQAVTASMNPDGLLGKEGGYSACIYFTAADVDAAAVPGGSIVEKGTDAGGAVEIYATADQAQARCDYLAGFDGTILYSGSYAIVGTMVVRTSYRLTDGQQLILTRAITAALTALDEAA